MVNELLYFRPPHVIPPVCDRPHAEDKIKKRKKSFNKRSEMIRKQSSFHLLPWHPAALPNANKTARFTSSRLDTLIAFMQFITD